MPNRKAHVAIGVGITILVYLLNKNSRNEASSLGEVITVGVLGGAAAILPDILDTPISPRHRSVGHSMALSGSLIPILQKIKENPQINQNQKDVAVSVFAGFASHLAMDAGTPAGLPFFD